MDTELSANLDQFRRDASKLGEETVFKLMPGKVLELTKLIQAMSSSTSPFHSSHMLSHTDTTIYPPPPPVGSDDGNAPKKRKREGDSEGLHCNGAEAGTGHAVYTSLVVSNKHVLQIQDTVKVEAQQLAEYVDAVKLWVNLTMPKIEDGDNFGVQIQEEVLNELHRAQESAYNIRDAGRVANLTRAKIASKMIKYPNIEDYSLSLRDHDEKQHQVSRQYIIDLRNMYAILTDIIHKNISKIRAPKANNHATLY